MKKTNQENIIKETKKESKNIDKSSEEQKVPQEVKKPTKNPKKKKRRNKKIPNIIKNLIVILIIIAIPFGIKIYKDMTHEETIINFGFKDVGVLVTQEWYGRIVEDSSMDRKIFKKYSIPFTKSRIIFSIDVMVSAGIDFKEIEYEIINENTIKIKLPKSEVYEPHQVKDSFKNYLSDESWFTDIAPEKVEELKNEVVERGTQQAIEAGLLTKADQNAKKIIEQMIKQKKEYNIIWEYK